MVGTPKVVVETERHEITLNVERRVGSSEDWYRAVCSCGRYDSTLNGLPGKPMAAGREHAKAKNRLILEMDPTELRPGDVVLSIVDRDADNPETCHCDVRVTVERKED